MQAVVRKTLMVVSAAIAFAGMSVGVASADPGVTYPGSASYPSAPITGMGSDTTQTVMNALAAQAANSTSAPKFESWDAINPSTGAIHDAIKNNYRRANGSSEGQAAISRVVDKGSYPKGCGLDGTTTLTGRVQFARSSSGPKNPATAGDSRLTFIPFARDAVGYVYDGNATALGKLTQQQISDIYQGNITSVNGTTVHPYLPQAGSGTRSFFLTHVVGLTTEPAFWSSLPVTEENDARAINANGDIFPFSASNWIAQKNAVQTNNTGIAHLGSPDGVYPVAGSSPNLRPSDSFFGSTVYGRDVYNVVSTSTVTTSSSSFNSNLYKLFVNDGSGKPALRQFDATTTKFGFSLKTAGVNGSTTLKGALFANPASLANC